MASNPELCLFFRSHRFLVADNALAFILFILTWKIFFAIATLCVAKKDRAGGI